MSGRRRVVLLGATGSVGTQACDVIARHPDRFELVGATAANNARGLAEVMERFSVPRGALLEAGVRASTGLASSVGVGLDAICDIAALPSDVVCVAITGAAALRPTLAAIGAGRTVATATKEVLVMAGELVTRLAAVTGSRILAIDSEHSALWQCLRGERADTVRRLILTASGGPFRNRDPATFGSITAPEALRHPTWKMGPKITIDSATMMNKGLEIIEAHFLFEVDYARIDVLIHPTSIIHSMVEFCDGATMAQLGHADMRVPIALALNDGARLSDVAAAVDPLAVSPLELLPADPGRFPAVAVARAAGEQGGVAPAVLNAANEVLVDAFLRGACRFNDIVPLVEETVVTADHVIEPSLEDVVAADAWARIRATELLTVRSTHH
ncbi:MAG: 1-deoxy-D-xylulose-5-phosphate reductoisomerase [Candidatus Dormibacteria bacterium]